MPYTDGYKIPSLVSEGVLLPDKDDFTILLSQNNKQIYPLMAKYKYLWSQKIWYRKEIQQELSRAFQTFVAVWA